MQTFEESDRKLEAVVPRSWVGRQSVAKHHRSVGGQSQVYHSGRAMVLVLGPEFMPINLRMACEGRELASLSWCDRKSLLLLGQLCTFCLLVCQSLPNIDVNASLRSNDNKFNDCSRVQEIQIFSTRKSVLSWSRFDVNLA